MSLLNFQFSLPEFLALPHSHLHTAKYPLLHLYLTSLAHLGISHPLLLLLVELPPPHAEVPVAHVLLDYRRISLSFL